MESNDESKLQVYRSLYTHLTPDAYNTLRKAKVTKSQIAKVFDVSTAYVSKVRANMTNPYLDPLERAMQLVPWENMPSEHKTTAPYHRVRDHLHFLTGKGEGMSEQKLRRLRAWYERMETENVILEYDPDTPPYPGQKYGGWEYVPRRPEDGDLVIRENRYTRIETQYRDFWRIPENKP